MFFWFKAAQVAAKILSAPLELVKVKPTDLIAGANSSVTGGCFGSDLVAHVISIRSTFLNFLKYVLLLGYQNMLRKIERKNGYSEEIFDKTTRQRTHLARALQSLFGKRCRSLRKILVYIWTAFFKVKFVWFEYNNYRTETKTHPKGYDIFGSVCMEVEVDVLTGNFMVTLFIIPCKFYWNFVILKIHRTDIIEDVGRSLSPFIDVGQVEGAFIMGLGYYTSEIVKYDKKTGEKLSNGTWVGPKSKLFNLSLFIIFHCIGI